MKTKAVVTGHSRGLGAAITRSLLDAGIPVLGISRKEGADAAEGALTQLAIDLADPGALTGGELADTMRSFLAGADRVLLVNNAGMVHPIGPIGTSGAADILTAVTLNVAAPLALADLFQNIAASATDRRILHISSGAGRRGMAGWSIYCATKAALDNHARAVREDAISGLKITSLAPGVVDTDMQADIRGSTVEQFPALDEFKAMKAEGKLTSAQAAGEKICAYLLSERFADDTVTDLRTL